MLISILRFITEHYLVFGALVVLMWIDLVVAVLPDRPSVTFKG